MNKLFSDACHPTKQTIVTPDAWTDFAPWIDQDDPDIDGYVASLEYSPDYDLAEKLTEWNRNGIVVFENAISSFLIDEYLEDIDHLMRCFRDYDIPIEMRGTQLSSLDLESFPENMTGIKLNQMQCFSRAAARLSISRNISDFLSHVFNAPASVCQSLTFWRGSEQPIHIDYPYVRQQKKLSYLAASWIPLEDIQPGSGPLGYYPGGHKVSRSGFFDWGNGSIIHDEHSERNPSDFAEFLYKQMAVAGIQRKDFYPKKGDVLIWHGNLPHEGTPVSDPSMTRKSYVTHYTSESTLPDWMRSFDSTGVPLGVFENGAYSYRYKWFDEKPTLPSWS